MQIATATSDGDDQKEQISENVLVIEISGPDVFSMEIIDTPGMIRSE